MVPCIEANCTPGQPSIEAFYSETPPGTEENFFVVRGSGRFFTGIALIKVGSNAFFLNSESHESPEPVNCVISFIISGIIELVLFWPLFLRFCYVHRVSSIVHAFYTNSDEQLAKAR